MEEKKYEIEIVDGVDFKAARYFDITANNWKLDKLVSSVLEEASNNGCKIIFFCITSWEKAKRSKIQP